WRALNLRPIGALPTARTGLAPRTLAALRWRRRSPVCVFGEMLSDLAPHRRPRRRARRVLLRKHPARFRAAAARLRAPCSTRGAADPPGRLAARAAGAP